LPSRDVKRVESSSAKNELRSKTTAEEVLTLEVNNEEIYGNGSMSLAGSGSGVRKENEQGTKAPGKLWRGHDGSSEYPGQHSA
jgi:hypothetical protein